MNFILQKAEPKDYETIYEIKKNALGEYITKTWGWDENLQRRFHDEEMNAENIYVIIVEGNNIGTVGKIENENEIVINRLYIIDRFQSNGIGTKIVENIIASNRHKDIRLRVLKKNPRAKELYLKLGFIVTGEENEHLKMIKQKK